MQKLMPGLLLVLFALLAAETKPAPATYVTNADIQAIFKQAPENSVVDKQIRSVNVGKVNVAYSDIAALVFTGRDTAAGKTFEAWVKKYWEKKAAGEKGFGLHPEALE